MSQRYRVEVHTKMPATFGRVGTTSSHPPAARPEEPQPDACIALLSHGEPFAPSRLPPSLLSARGSHYIPAAIAAFSLRSLTVAAIAAQPEEPQQSPPSQLPPSLLSLRATTSRRHRSCIAARLRATSLPSLLSLRATSSRRLAFALPRSLLLRSLDICDKWRIVTYMRPTQGSKRNWLCG
jgi:hypothetical protein